MTQKYSFLKPIKIGPIEFKNRIVYPAMGKHLATTDGFVTDRFIEYFRSVAKGGVAALVTGIQVIDPSAPYISDRQTWICDDKYIPGLRKFAEEIHKEDCKVFFQPWHSGQAGQVTGVGASNTSFVNSLSIDDIRRIQKQWFDAARRAKEAGADGIEFHLAHTYLASQFLSPYFNQRADEYGSDTVENSMRFSIEIIEQIKKQLVDEQFIVIAKINGDDFVEGGTTIQRTMEACKLLEKAGVEMITVNGGGSLTKITGMSDNGAKREGWKVNFAESVKSVVKIPVVASGSLRHPEYVDAIIREGKCDLAAIGRGIFAEREWVKKCIEGRKEELRYCTSCMFCFTTAPDGDSGCSVNPFAKRELEKPELIKDGQGRNVVVVGAGPSGLEAAVTLAERDFKVTVFEKENKIGGLVAFAMMPPDKSKLGWMLEYYDKQIKRLGIKLRLNTKATTERIISEKPYAVIFASGSKEFLPPIEGLLDGTGIGARDMFAKIDAGGKVENDCVVLGGGLTGIELAHLLKSKGAKVTVLELLPKTENPTLEQKLALEAAIADGVQVLFRQKVNKIDKNILDVTDLENQRNYQIEAKQIIRSMGIRPEITLMEEYIKKFDSSNVYSVGDCNSLGKINTAVSTGADVAYALR